MSQNSNSSLRLPSRIADKFPTPDGIRTVVVMCTGNICRSPIGEGVLQAQLKERGLSDIEVLSAGTVNMEGSSASAESVEVCADHGIDIADHHSQKLSAELADRADAILVMEERHLYFLAVNYPQALDKACLLGDFSAEQPGEEIDDPIQLPIEFYRIAYDKISHCCSRFADWIASQRKA